MKIRQWTAALLTAGFLMSGVGAGAAEIDPAKPDCETAVIGDVNRDGLVQVDDATLVQSIVAGIEGADDLFTLRLADADGSGVCDIDDATTIQRSCADIDAVCVTTPTTMHREVILKAHGSGNAKTRTEAYNQIKMDRARYLMDLASNPGDFQETAELVVKAMGVYKKGGSYAPGAVELLAEKLG